jgi:hypothetical protein
MTIRVFVVIATRGQGRIKDALVDQEVEYFEIKTDAWLVASDNTTRALAEKLGIRNGEKGAGLVVSIDTYSGRLPKDTWEWLRLHEAEGE